MASNTLLTSVLLILAINCCVSHEHTHAYRQDVMTGCRSHLTSILVEVEPDQIPQLQRRTGHRMLPVFLDVRYYVYYIIDCAIFCANGVFKRGECDSTAIERQTLEGSPPFVFVSTPLLPVFSIGDISSVFLIALLAHASKFDHLRSAAAS